MKKVMTGDVIVVGALVLVGALAMSQVSQSEGDKAAGAYQQARNAGASHTQMCRSAKAVEATYRANGQGSRADQWAQTAAINCNSAALIEGYRPY